MKTIKELRRPRAYAPVYFGKKKDTAKKVESKRIKTRMAAETEPWTKNSAGKRKKFKKNNRKKTWGDLKNIRIVPGLKRQTLNSVGQQ